MRFAIIGTAALVLAPVWGQPERHVVMVDLDGVRRDLLDTAYLGGGMPQLERLFGRAVWGQGFSSALYFESATTIAPSVTMSGQASLFTGAYPGAHGVPGDSWFDRDRAAGVDYFTSDGVTCIFDFSLLGGSGCKGGLANGHLTSPTIYEWASAADRTSVVMYNPYWKGATRAVLPSVLDALAVLQGSTLDFEYFDRDMAARAIAELREHGRPALLTIYFAGADLEGHASGTGAAIDYLARVIDPLLGSILDAIEQIDSDWQSNTLFIFSADHGRTDTFATPGDELALGRIADALASAGFDAEHAFVSNEGGLAHIYLRPEGASWSEAPEVAGLRAAAEPLAAALSEELESVCYRDAGYQCLNRLDGDRTRLLDQMNSRRTGDLILLAKPGRYLGNSASAGAEHGSLSDTDLAVPLILCGGGLKPGRVTGPVSTVQIAATIANYLGFAAPGAQPALPQVFSERRKKLAR